MRLAVAVSGFWYGLSIENSELAAACIVSALGIAGLLLLKKDRFPGMNLVKIASAVISTVLGVMLVLDPSNTPLFWVLVGFSGVLGVVLTISIGGADMPVVIALLNSYSGLAAAATGYVINNTVLIISGSLVGGDAVICAIWGDGRCTREVYTANIKLGNDNDARVYFTVEVPAGVKLELSNISGNLSAVATAPVHAKTMNGDVRVATSVGPVRGETLNGSVDIRMSSLAD